MTKLSPGTLTALVFPAPKTPLIGQSVQPLRLFNGCLVEPPVFLCIDLESSNSNNHLKKTGCLEFQDDMITFSKGGSGMKKVASYCWCFSNPIPNHLACRKPVNSGINYQPQPVQDVLHQQYPQKWTAFNWMMIPNHYLHEKLVFHQTSIHSKKWAVFGLSWDLPGCGPGIFWSEVVELWWGRPGWFIRLVLWVMWLGGFCECGCCSLLGISSQKPGRRCLED